jgi:hypothetical protein
MTEHEAPRYSPPTADELRILIKKYWQEHQDPAKQQHADDPEFLDLKVRATQRRLRDLIRGGMQPTPPRIRQ